MVYRSIQEQGGATCDEVEADIGMIHQSASARIRGLVQVGMLRPSGTQRKTRRGRRAIVWVVNK